MTHDDNGLSRLTPSHWLTVLLAVGLVAALRPHPVPDPLRDPVRAAAQHLEHGRSAAALAELERALEFSPHLTELRATAVDLAFRTGRPARALEHLEQLPKDANVDRVCVEAAAQLELGEAAEAAQVVQRAPLRCPLSTEALAGLASAALQEGQVEAARALAERWIRLQPDSSPAALELAVLSAVSDPLNAGPHLGRVLELDPGSGLAAELARAVEDGRAAESEAYGHAQVAQALARAGRWHAARLSLERALELEPEYLEARAYYGLALDRTGGDGRVQLERAYAASDGASLAASFLGLHWLDAGEPQRALPYLERAVSLSPENPAYQAQLGAAHERSGDLQVALGHYERAAGSDQPMFLRLAAEFSLRNEIALEQLGIPAARRAFRLGPGPETADLLGYAHLLNGDLTVAARLLGRAAHWAPASAEVHYHLALLQLERGRVDDAAGLLMRTIELEPDGRHAELAQRALERLDR